MYAEARSSSKLLNSLEEHVVHSVKETSTCMNSLYLPRHHRDSQQIPDKGLGFTQEVDPLKIELDEKSTTKSNQTVVVEDNSGEINSTALFCPQPIRIKDEKGAYVPEEIDLPDCYSYIAELAPHGVKNDHEPMQYCVQECEPGSENEDVHVIAMSIVTLDEDRKQDRPSTIKLLQDLPSYHGPTKLDINKVVVVNPVCNVLNSQLSFQKTIEIPEVSNNVTQSGKKKLLKRKKAKIAPFVEHPSIKIGKCMRTYAKKSQDSSKLPEIVNILTTPSTSVCRPTIANNAEQIEIGKHFSKTQKEPTTQGFIIRLNDNTQVNLQNGTGSIDSTVETSFSSVTLSDPLLQTEHCDTITNSAQRKATKLFRCTVCSHSFPSLALCAEHLKSHPDKEILLANSKRKKIARKNYLCDLCGITFRENGQLTNHVKVHHYGLQLFKCGECKPEKAFSSKNGMKCHIQLKHGCGLTCLHCNCTFPSKSLFSKHMKKHDVNPRKFTHVKRNKPFRECPICSKVFKYQPTLERHLRSHTGETPFKCSYCPRRFSCNYNRDQHECIHTGKKLYKCKKCDMRFQYSVPRNIHMQSHSNEMEHKEKTLND